MSLDFSDDVYDFDTRPGAGQLLARAVNTDGGERTARFAEALDVSTSVPFGKQPG